MAKPSQPSCPLFRAKLSAGNHSLEQMSPSTARLHHVKNEAHNPTVLCRTDHLLCSPSHPDGMLLATFDVTWSRQKLNVLLHLCLQDRPVVVFANLKPRNMRGIKSNGMLVAASNADHTQVELVTPPREAQPGERIWFGGEGDAEQAAAAGANQV